MLTTYYNRPPILAEPGLQQGHGVIEASAGTGKTFTLEHLVLELIINSRAKIEEILVVTFTDAATRELRERVRGLIRKVCDEGLEVKPDGDAALYWEVNQATRSRLREALFRFDGAAISTIHGFCQRILSEQAFLGGRLFEQEHVDGAEMFGFAFREEVRTALVESSPVGDALKLWLEQGETLQNLQELLYRCHREGCPERCPVTPHWDPEGFIKGAAGFPRQEKLLAEIEVFFTDTNSRSGYKKLINTLFETADTIDPAALQDSVEKFLEWAGKDCTINKVKSFRFGHLHRAAQMECAPDIIKELAGIVEGMLLRAASESSFFVYQLLPRVQERLMNRKRSLGLLDYDDMLLGVREALTGPGAGTLLELLRGRWRYALVDEFQDTDPVQWEIFRRIFVDGRGGRRLFVIGDPKQAIYGFRGADVHTYDLAKKQLLTEWGASRLALSKNYRSTEALIKGVNEILTAEDEMGQGFFDGLNSYKEPVECGDPSRRALEEGRPGVPVHLIHLYGEGEKLSADSVRRGTACFIAEEILRLTDPGKGLLTGKGDKEPVPIKLSDIYILTRTAKEGVQIGEVLRRYGIAFAFYKMEGLFKTPEAEDLHRLLYAIESPADGAARMLAWLTPFFGVPLKDLSAWQGVGENHPLNARLLKWKGLADGGQWARLFDDILTSSGLVRRLIFSDGERALTNYLHLFEVLLAEAHSHPVTLRELTRGLKARIDGRKMPEGREGDLQRLETDKDAVQILTMHKAKGLEAEVVFVGGGFGNPGNSGEKMEIYHRDHQRCLHIGKAVGEIADAVIRGKREEEQRLAYVAVTRAKSRLYLPYFGPAVEGAPEDRCYGYKSLGSFYKNVQKQLDLLCSKGRFQDQSSFVLREVSCRVRPPREQRAGIDMKGWPREELLKPPPTMEEEAEKIKPGRRGILLTSYTRMKRGKGWQPPPADEDGQSAWRRDEVEGEVRAENIIALPDEHDDAPTAPGPVLPGGREAGIFLHALLEDTGADEIKARSFVQWSGLPEVQERSAAAARRHGFSEDYLPGALQMVYHALRTPIKVESCEESASLIMPGGIAAGTHQRSEMSFVYPIPEKFHPLLAGSEETAAGGAVDSLPYQGLRGYLQGLIDLVFQYEGKIYLLDWKSDSLPSFDKSSLQAHVQANYSLQAKVYALAVLRLLCIRTAEEYESLFGGVLYLFLRGIRPQRDNGSRDGVWYSRPAWPEVVAWEQELLVCNDWGGEVIELKEAAGEARL